MRAQNNETAQGIRRSRRLIRGWGPSGGGPLIQLHSNRRLSVKDIMLWGADIILWDIVLRGQSPLAGSPPADEGNFVMFASGRPRHLDARKSLDRYSVNSER